VVSRTYAEFYVATPQPGTGGPFRSETPDTLGYEGWSYVSLTARTDDPAGRRLRLYNQQRVRYGLTCNDEYERDGGLRLVNEGRTSGALGARLATPSPFALGVAWLAALVTLPLHLAGVNKFVAAATGLAAVAPALR
jgi:hypothetical protein